MRKFALLLLSGAALTGCALTDYGDAGLNGVAQSRRIMELNASRALLGCCSAGVPACLPGEAGFPHTAIPGETSDAIVARIAAEHIRCRNVDPNKCLTNPVGTGFQCPPLSVNLVSAGEADQWMGELAAWANQANLGVTSTLPEENGSWTSNGVKSLGTVCDPATGEALAASSTAGFATIRLTTMFTQRAQNTGFGPLPCGFDATPYDGGAAGNGSEGQMFGNSIAGHRMEGGWTDAIALDNSPNIEFGANLHSVWGPRNAGFGFGVLVGTIGRANEQRLDSAFVKKSAGAMVPFLSGGRTTVAIPGTDASVVMSAELGEEGFLNVFVHEVKVPGSTFVPSTPIWFGVHSSMQALRLDLANQQAVVAELASWVMQHADLTQPLATGGDIPELGVTLPEYHMLFNPAWVESLVTRTAGTPKSGGRSRG